MIWGPIMFWNSRRTRLIVPMVAALLLFAGCGDDDPVGPEGDDPVADCIDYGDYLHLAGSVDTPGFSRSVAVQGNYAYVADGDSGLQVLDITTPGTPEIVGSIDTPGSAIGVAVHGDYAYVADDESGLQVVDITTPGTPEIVGSVDTPGSARGVAVQGNYAHVADDWLGLQVVDVTTPEAPVIAGSVDTPGSAMGLAVQGDYVYVADGLGLQVVDITTPEAPETVGGVGTDWALGVAVAHTGVCVAVYWSGLQIAPRQCGDAGGF